MQSFRPTFGENKICKAIAATMRCDNEESHPKLIGANMKTEIIVFINGQKYECVGTEKYEKKRTGQRIRLLKFESRCADCGQKFVVKTTKGRLRKSGSLNRRCSECKSPGRRVSRH